jgi:hypothetical protein
MTRSSRRIGRTKAIAKVLAMIADAFPEKRAAQRHVRLTRVTNGFGKAHPILCHTGPLHLARERRIESSPGVSWLADRNA